MYLLGKQFRGTSLYNLMLAIRVSSYRDGGPRLLSLLINGPVVKFCCDCHAYSIESITAAYDNE